MKFRPCIDIHNGKVKQIVGGSLLDQGDQAVENFAADQEADYFANLYKKDGLKGGHVILLNPSTSEYYPETKKQALKALQTYQIVPEMHHWQISHLGVIIPLADAYYQSRHPEKICANEKLMTLTAYRMKKNLKWIAQKGMLCPAKLYMIKDMPTGMLAGVLSRVYQSEFGNKFLYRHAMHAPEEFQRLHQEFYNYMKTHTKESNKA